MGITYLDEPKVTYLDDPNSSEFADELKRRGKAAIGGIEAAGSIVSQIPSFVGGGFMGAMDPTAPLTMEGRAEAIKKWQERIPSYKPQTEEGKTVFDMLQSARETSGEMGGDSPALRTANEVAFDIGTMALPMAPRGRGLSPQAKAYNEGLASIEKSKQRSPEPKPTDSKITYLDTPIEKVQTLQDFNKDAAYAGIIDPAYATRKQIQIEGPPKPESFEFGARDAIDFPLRQEVLDSPEVKQITDSYRLEHERMKQEGASPAEIAQLEQAFGEYMQKFGVRSPQEATGLRRPLYESGVQKHQLPIERTDRPDLGTPQRVADWTKHEMSPFEVYSEPLALVMEQARNKGSRDPFRGPGKRQAGAVNMEVFRDGFNRLKVTVGGLKLTAFTQRDLNKLPETLKKYVREEPEALKIKDYVDDLTQNPTQSPQLRDFQWATKGPMFRIVASDAKTGKPMGLLELRSQGGIEKFAEADWVWTDEKFRGTGVAEQMYTFARELGNDIRASQTQTPMGKKMFQGMSTKAGPPKTSMGRLVLPAIKPDPFVGPGKKQAGGWNSKGDPEFQAFKDSLPEPLKGQAKAMYKEYKKQIESVEVKENEGLDAAKDIPGIDDILKDYQDVFKSFDELKPSFEASTDIPGNIGAKLLTETLSGPQFIGRTFNSPMVKWGGGKVRLAVQNAGRQVSEILYNAETGVVPLWTKLSKEQRIEWRKVVLENEGKRSLTADELRAKGYGKEVSDFYLKTRSALDQMWEYGNAIRQLQGFKPLTKREGHFPAKFVGEFYVTVTKERPDGTVEIVGLYPSNSFREVKTFQKHLREKYSDDYKVSDIQEKGRGGNREGSTHAYSVYSELMQAVESGSADAAALGRIIEEFQQNEVSKTAGFYQHTKAKKGIEGSSGRNEVRDAVRNADDMMRALQGYTHQLYEYGEFAKISKEYGRLLDKSELPGKEITQDYLQWYFDQARGAESAFSKLQNDLIDMIAHNIPGFPLAGNTLRAGGGAARSFITWNLLSGYNFRFLTQQLLQPSQFLLHSLASIQARSGNKISSAGTADALFKGYRDMMAFTTSGKPPKHMVDAYNWGVKNHIFDQSLLHDLSNILKDPGVNSLQVLNGNWAIRKTEQLSRLHVYMTMEHLLKDVIPNKEQRFTVAGDITTGMMTDYRPFEMPKLYRQWGPVGSAASSLIRFKHNLVSQGTSMVSEWMRSKYDPKLLAPIMLFVSVNTMLSGLLGLPFREDMDLIANLLKRFNFVDANPTQVILNSDNPTYVTHGLISGITGSDMSASLSPGSVLPHGTDLIDALPLIAKGQKIVEAAWEAATKRTKAKGLEFLKEAGPTSGLWQGPVEYMAREASPRGDIVMGKDNKGSVMRREPSDWVRRGMSLTPIEESKEKTRNYEFKKDEALRKGKIETLYDRAYEDLRRGENVLSKYSADMQQWNITPAEMLQAMQRIHENRLTTDLERLGGMPPTSPNQIRRYQELHKGGR